MQARRTILEVNGGEPADPQSPQAIVRRLAEIVWHYSFMHYFWLKEHRDKGQQPR